MARPDARAVALVACIATGGFVGLAVHAVRAKPVGAPPAPSVRSGPTADATWRAGQRRAPAFSLRDQSGRVVSMGGGARRAPVLLAFLDSHCRLICTFEGPTIADVIHRARGIPMQLLVVSVNPWEDTAASARAAARRWGFAGEWHWLRAPAARLRPVWRDYGIEVLPQDGDISHSSAIYLIDARGYERAGFDYPFTARQVVRELRRIARSSSSSEA